MPRPGPRPYECVRRAWHSERHQPMRGALIKEVFRIVEGVHTAVTKRNKEWQHKLPVVVLKVEEILYSKAMSEFDYLDLKTLRFRLNDAINTIIRREESTETGVLLPPCVEAALHLGCKPRKSSRSQRNCPPRFYLSSISPDDNGDQDNSIAYSVFLKYVTCQNSIVQNENGSIENFPAVDNGIPYRQRPLLPLVSDPPPMPHPSYPLYYGNCFQSEAPPHGFGNFCPNLTSNAVEPIKINLLPTSFGLEPPNLLAKTSTVGISAIPPDADCDLSLRLGPILVTSQQTPANETGSSSGSSSSSLEVSKQSAFAPYCCSKPEEKDPFDSRKRKAKAIAPLEVQHYPWQALPTYQSLTESIPNCRFVG